MRWVAAVLLVLGTWTSISAGLALAVPPGRSMAIVAPGRDGVRIAIAAGGLLIGGNRMVVIARSDDPDFVRRLYAAGALLVLDAEDAGACSGRWI